MSTQKLIESRFVTGPDDALATSDVYEVTENAIRSRASGFSDTELTMLLGMLKIPFEPLTEIIDDILDLLSELLAALQSRVNDFLSTMGDALRDLLGGDGGIDVTESLLEYADRSLLWDFEGELIYVDPSNKGTYEAILEELRLGRRSGRPNQNKAIVNAIDQGAETIVYTEFISKVLEAGLPQPIDELLGKMSSDGARQTVCQNCFPNAVDKTQTGVIDPTNFPAYRPGEREAKPLNPTSVTTNAPTVSVNERFTNVNSSSGRQQNPWLTGERGLVGEDEETDNGVTFRPSPFTPIDLNEGPDAGHWEVFSPSNPANPTNAVENVYGNRDGLNSGFRDNHPKWLPSDKNATTGFDWGSIDALKKYADPNIIISRYPGILGMILYYYAYPEGDYSLQEEYENLVGLMDWLSPDWATAIKEGESLSKLLYFSTASEDAVNLLTMYDDTDFRVEVMIAREYRHNDIPSLLKSQYPDLVI